MGGLAFTDAEFPTSGWSVAAHPFETIEEIPPDAIAAGEGVNLWRHHLLAADGVRRLFYNSGPYGHEQLYSKQQFIVGEADDDEIVLAREEAAMNAGLMRVGAPTCPPG